jgi:hypothetical protein
VLVADGLVAAVGISRFAGLLDSLPHEFVDTGFGEVGYFYDPPSIASKAERSGLHVLGSSGSRAWIASSGPPYCAFPNHALKGLSPAISAICSALRGPNSMAPAFSST